MIDRDATIAKFGYDPDTLSRGSQKRVIAVCEECGKVRDIHKRLYRDMCISCAAKKYFEDPAARKKTSVALKKHHKDHPEIGDEQSIRMKKRYENPQERKKQSATRKKYFKEHPEAREKNSAAVKKHFEDPEARKRLSATIQGIPYEQWEAFAKEQKYCPAFNEACRESNREKYGRRCFICGKHESENITRNGKQKKLSVHHVDLQKDQGCNGHAWKLVPICLRHHKAAHTSLWIGRITYLLRNIDYNHH